MTLMEGGLIGGAGKLKSMSVDSAGAAMVTAGTRQCVGRETITLSSGAASSLTPPVEAVAAHIQADGGSVRIRLDATAPTATVGTRLDDGVIYPVDTPLADVRLIAQSGGSTVVQVAYFDRP